MCEDIGENRTDEFLTSRLDSKPKLDVALFFHGNPDTMDTAASIATWTGYRESELSDVLDELVAGGVLRRTGDILRLTSDGEIRAEIEQIARYYETARGAVEDLVARLHQDRARMAEEIEQLEVSMDAILNGMGEGLIVTNTDGTVRLINPGAVGLLGLGGAVRTGLPAAEAFAGTPLQECVTEARAAEHKRTVTELRVPEGDEMRYIRVTSQHIRVEGGSILGHVFLLSDVTDIRRLDQLKSDLISFVSHELKAPITAVKGYTGSLLSSAIELDEQTRSDFLRTIDSEADRLSRLIDGFLDITRLDAGRPIEIVRDEFDVRELVEQAIEIQLAVSNRCIPRPELGGEVGAIAADRDKILQVLTNLLSNAVKYSPAGRDVVVTVERDALETRISVIDHGLGISPEQLRNLFVPYYRITDPKRKSIRGTGLGLYLSKHLVEAHGGRLGCESREGEGSTFWFTISDPPEGEEA